MSAGNFIRARYQASYGNGRNVHPIRVQPETISLTVGGTSNQLPPDPINIPLTAVVSKGRRARGLIVRTVTLQTPIVDPPAGYLPGGLTTLPCLTPDFFDACAAADDTTTVSYLDTVGFVVAYVSDELAR